MSINENNFEDFKKKALQRAAKTKETLEQIIAQNKIKKGNAPNNDKIKKLEDEIKQQDEIIKAKKDEIGKLQWVNENANDINKMLNKDIITLEEKIKELENQSKAITVDVGTQAGPELSEAGIQIDTNTRDAETSTSDKRAKLKEEMLPAAKKNEEFRATRDKVVKNEDEQEEAPTTKTEEAQKEDETPKKKEEGDATTTTTEEAQKEDETPKKKEEGDATTTTTTEEAPKKDATTTTTTEEAPKKKEDVGSASTTTDGLKDPNYDGNINLETTINNEKIDKRLHGIKIRDFVDAESLNIFKDITYPEINDDNIKKTFDYLKNITLTTNDLTNKKLRDIKLDDIENQIKIKKKPIEEEINSIEEEKNEMKGIEKYLNTITNNFENIDIDIGNGNSGKVAPKKNYMMF